MPLITLDVKDNMNRKYFAQFFLIVGMLLTLAGCNLSESKEEKAAVAQFRTMLTASQYHELYLAASPQLRDATSEANFIKGMEKLKAQLGPYRDGSAELIKRAKSVSSTNSGVPTLRLTYRSAFTHYSSVEEVFAFEDTAAGLKLMGYHYESL